MRVEVGFQVTHLGLDFVEASSGATLALSTSTGRFVHAALHLHGCCWETLFYIFGEVVV